MEGQDRDRERFEEAYDAYSGLILAYALRRIADPQDAADVVAETFLVAWRRIADLPAGDEARPWLYGVARRVLANRHRGERRRRQLHQRLAADLSPLAREATVTLEGSEWSVAAFAFAELSDHDREVLTLAGWDGLDRGEIATVLGCSRAAARVRLHRARRRFARALATARAQDPSVAAEAGNWRDQHGSRKESR